MLDFVGENRTRPRLDLPGRVASLGLGAHVRLSGFVEDDAIATRYSAADAAVFLSEYEGFGLPALECAARGVPLVVGRSPSLGEIFRDAALLVDPRDETEVAAAIDRVLTDAALRARLVERRTGPRRPPLLGRRRPPHARGPPGGRRVVSDAPGLAWSIVSFEAREALLAALASLRAHASASDRDRGRGQRQRGRVGGRGSRRPPRSPA